METCRAWIGSAMPFRLSTLIVILALAPLAWAAPTDDHWAWKPPARPAAPAGHGPPPINPIDAFIRAKLDAAGLSPAPPAGREQLLRRVTFDLTGLPPTLDEISDF